ncbi:MAG: ArnT family glycosyltransferase, partial [Tepidiformaceae bacterium]
MAVAEGIAGRDAAARDVLGRARATARRLVAPVALVAISAVPVLLTIPFLHEPFDRDEGAYATIAQGLTHGLLPYRDLFDHKPPVIYGWYALSFRVFGDSVVAPRLMGALVLAAITLLLFRACSMLYGQRAGWLGAVAFALSTGVALINPAMNTKPFTLLP